jgi:hypothetical protein
MTTDNFCFYLQNRLIQTSQIGGQRYSDTSPFSIPWSKYCSAEHPYAKCCRADYRGAILIHRVIVFQLNSDGLSTLSSRNSGIAKSDSFEMNGIGSRNHLNGNGNAKPAQENP